MIPPDLSVEPQAVAKRKEEFDVERHPYPGLVIYEIAGDDLDQLEQEGLSIGEDFSFALGGLTMAVSFTVTLATVAINSDRTFLSFLLLTVLGYIVAVFFGVRWWRGRKRRATMVNKIRRRGGPYGEEGTELAAKDAAALPPREDTSER